MAGCFANAAIDCKPGMGGGCDNEPTDPLHPPTNGFNPKYLAVTYAEIPSANCLGTDLALAQQQAQEKALREAQFYYKNRKFVQTSARFSQSCEHGIYAGSSDGLSWIVQYFANYVAQ